MKSAILNKGECYYTHLGNVFNAIDNVQLDTTGSLASTVGVKNPYRYRGYRYDIESGLYYVTSRYYNPEIGRFLNADGLVSTGQGLLGTNMYAFCENNSINKVDFTGCNPGDLFNSQDEAAQDFMNFIGQKSIDNDWEYGATIYSVTFITSNIEYVDSPFIKWNPFTLMTSLYIFKKQNSKIPKITFVKEEKYSYTKPHTIRFDNFIPPKLMLGQKALIHTHGASEKGDDSCSMFSWPDKCLAKITGMPFYLVTPTLYLKKYDPNTGNVTRPFGLN